MNSTGNNGAGMSEFGLGIQVMKLAQQGSKEKFSANKPPKNFNRSGYMKNIGPQLPNLPSGDSIKLPRIPQPKKSASQLPDDANLLNGWGDIGDPVVGGTKVGSAKLKSSRRVMLSSADRHTGDGTKWRESSPLRPSPGGLMTGSNGLLSSKNATFLKQQQQNQQQISENGEDNAGPIQPPPQFYSEKKMRPPSSDPRVGGGRESAVNLGPGGQTGQIAPSGGKAQLRKIPKPVGKGKKPVRRMKAQSHCGEKCSFDSDTRSNGSNIDDYRFSMEEQGLEQFSIDDYLRKLHDPNCFDHHGDHNAGEYAEDRNTAATTTTTANTTHLVRNDSKDLQKDEPSTLDT